MNEKMKEGEKQEEVDDSGFFSGKIILLSKSVAPTNFLSQPFLFRPLSRWSGASGGCDHHHGRRASERDQSRSARRSHD